MWCNVSIVVFCSRIKRARCYHVLWKWTPYRVTYSSWGQVLTDARSNKTDFFKTILLNEVSKGIFFLDVVGLMDSNECHLPQNRGHIGNRNRRKLVLWFFHPVCPYPAFFFYLTTRNKHTTEECLSRILVKKKFLSKITYLPHQAQKWRIALQSISSKKGTAHWG